MIYHTHVFEFVGLAPTGGRHLLRAPGVRLRGAEDQTAGPHPHRRGLPDWQAEGQHPAVEPGHQERRPLPSVRPRVYVPHLSAPTGRLRSGGAVTKHYGGVGGSESSARRTCRATVTRGATRSAGRWRSPGTTSRPISWSPASTTSSASTRS